LARPIFILWALGVPLFTWGLATAHHGAIRVGSALLFFAVGTGTAYLVYMLRTASEPRG